MLLTLSRTRNACAAVAALFASFAANCEPVRFEFEGTCIQDCPQAGLDYGDRVYGHLIVDDAVLAAPEGEFRFSTNYIQEVEFHFGNQTFTTNHIVLDDFINAYYSRNVLDGTMVLINGYIGDNGTSRAVMSGAPLPYTYVFLLDMNTSTMARGIFRDTRSGFVPERLMYELLDSLNVAKNNEELTAQMTLALAHYSNPNLPKTCKAIAAFLDLVDPTKGAKVVREDAGRIIAEAEKIMTTIGCQ